MKLIALLGPLPPPPLQNLLEIIGNCKVHNMHLWCMDILCCRKKETGGKKHGKRNIAYDNIERSTEWKGKENRVRKEEGGNNDRNIMRSTEYRGNRGKETKRRRQNYNGNIM